MLRSEIDTIELELQIASTAEKRAAWAEKYGRDVVAALLEADCAESDRINDLEKENSALENEKDAARTKLEEAKTLAREATDHLVKICDQIEELETA